MKNKTKIALVLLVAYFATSNVTAQQNVTYSCNFTNIIATKWNNGEWNNAKFVPRINPFLIKIENTSVRDNSYCNDYDRNNCCESTNLTESR